MATRIEDPQLGTLIKIEEVSSLTGIPKPTLRLWRREQYRHLAKFDEYTHDSSNAVWYRLADIEGWLIANGKDPQGNRTMFTKTEAPNAFRAPVADVSNPIDAKKHEALVAAKKITNANFKAHREKLFKDFDNPSQAINAVIKRYIVELTDAWFNGEPVTPFINAYPSFDGLHPAFNKAPDPSEYDRAAFINTNITRLFDSEVNGRGLTVADVTSIPV